MTSVVMTQTLVISVAWLSVAVTASGDEVNGGDDVSNDISGDVSGDEL